MKKVIDSGAVYTYNVERSAQKAGGTFAAKNTAKSAGFPEGKTAQTRRIFRNMQGAPSAKERSVLPVRKRLSMRSNEADCEKDERENLENSITQRSGLKKSA